MSGVVASAAAVSMLESNIPRDVSQSDTPVPESVLDDARPLHGVLNSTEEELTNVKSESGAMTRDN